MRRFIIAAAVIFAAAIALDILPGLRGGAGWQWPYRAPVDWLPVAVLALGIAVYAAFALSLRRRSVRAALAWAVFGGTALAYLVVGVNGDPFFLLFTRTVSPVQTGASALQTRIMAADGVMPTLRRWPQIMDEALAQNLIHFTTSPPGQVLLHQAAADVFDSPALAGLSTPVSRSLRVFQCGDPEVMRYTRGEIVSAGLFAYLMPLFAALAVVPLYLTVRDLTGDRQLAVSVAGWWPLVPAALMFAPTWNTLYPTLCALAFWLLLRALISRRLWWAFASGLVMAGATLLNFAVLPFFLLAGLFTLGWYWEVERAEGSGQREGQKPLTTEGAKYTEGYREVSLREKLIPAVVVGVVFGAGVLLPWLVYALVTGVSPLDILGKTFGAHGELVRREYLPWLILHPYDVLLFTGIPAAILALWGAARVMRPRQPDALALFALAMAATALLVNFAGIVQGENARILIFYMPFLLVMGAATLRGRGADYDRPLFAAQAMILLAMAAVLPVVPLDLDPMPTAPRADIGSVSDGAWTEDGATFHSSAYAGSFALERYRWVGDPARQALSFEFEFGGDTPTERPYQFELVARADTDMGEIVSDPFRWWSQGEAYPPTCWRAGDLVRDTVVMPLPAVPHPVAWDVTLRAVDERSGDVMLTGDTESHLLVPIPYP